MTKQTTNKRSGHVYLKIKGPHGNLWGHGIVAGPVRPASWEKSAQAATPYAPDTARDLIRAMHGLFDIEAVPVEERPK